MAMQHRKYQLKPGTFDAFLDVFGTQIVPLRKPFGFSVVGAWASRAEEQFVWIVSHDGDVAAFQEAERAYYDSPQRLTIDPNPGDLIERADIAMVEPVDLS